LQKKHLQPALQFLKLGQHAQVSSPEYVRALMAFYQERYDEAVRECGRVLDRFPWLYEAKVLEGDIYSEMGARVIHQDSDKGLDLYQKAQEAYRQASSIGASNPEAYINLCEVSGFIIGPAFSTKGESVYTYWDQATTACKRAIQVDPENATTYAKLSLAEAEYSFFQGYAGEDPRPALQRAITAAKKATELKPQDPTLPPFFTGT
jgi:serine/threonine-protein kinase